MSPVANPVRPRALREWTALGWALTRTRDLGRSTPCVADPEPFTSEDWRERAEAAAACAGCPVLEQCRAFAVANAEPAHVWAGIDRASRTPPQQTRSHP